MQIYKNVFISSKKNETFLSKSFPFLPILSGTFFKEIKKKVENQNKKNGFVRNSAAGSSCGNRNFFVQPPLSVPAERRIAAEPFYEKNRNALPEGRRLIAKKPGRAPAGLPLMENPILRCNGDFRCRSCSRPFGASLLSPPSSSLTGEGSLETAPIPLPKTILVYKIELSFR